ncbi:MAG: hypothetical protein JWO90_3029 [Solirubrobacterales bacterium]|jgi:lipoprotein-anchoring transpeptidase ErfK/SrfK|nr:hypothetical protein [Solirubrobacterales bacterium]
MSKKTLLIPAVLLVVLLATAGGVFAFDGARTVEVAKGITVGGVDIGGLTPAVARQRLERELVAALQEPVKVHHDKATWTLGAREAKIETNVDAVVDDAVRRSEDGGMLGRTLRRVTGGKVEADLEPAVTFSDRAVVRLLDKVRKEVGRPAKDATLQITGSGVEMAPGRRGLQVKASELHEAINAALVSPTADRRFVAATRKVAPKVSTKDLARSNPVVLIADRGANTLRLYRDLELVKTYGIAAGTAEFPTPAGQFTIANKAVNPAWSVPNSDWAGSLQGQVIPGGSPENPLKARWMGIIDGVGIHGTSSEGSIGSNASHGCLRMRVADVVDLYPKVPVGAKILIT